MVDLYLDAVNKLAKWRAVFAGWQLGSRPLGDAESDAVRDHREATMLLRAEVTALMRALVEKGTITHADMQRLIAEEALHLDAMFERRFPGFKSTSNGMVMDVQVAAETMKGWRP